MPAPESVRYVFDSTSEQYISDRGQNFDWVSNVRVPEDLTRANIEAFISAAGARPNPEDGVVCSDRGYITPRYVEIIRKSRHTIKMQISVRSQLRSKLIGMVGVLDGAQPGNPVVCIKLHGEWFPNLYEEIVTTPGAPTPVAPIEAPANSGKARLYYSGAMAEYQSDSTQNFATEIIQGFRLQTDTVDAPPANFAPAVNCIGPLSQVFCPTRARRKGRHYIPTFLTTEANLPSQQLEIPVASAAPTDINDCGQALANLTHVVCLAYQGESNDRVHLIL